MENMSTDSVRLSFLRGRKIFLVQTTSIIRLEANSNYTRVYFADHPPLLMAKVLRAYDELLRPYGFLRTHRSHLVNLQYVNSLDQKGNILMMDNSIAEVSRRKKREVFQSISA